MGDNRTIAGKLTGVYGIKGWVKIHSYTEPADNIFRYQPWYLADSDGIATDRLLEVDQYRQHGNGLIVHIKGIDDREQAAHYCQQLVAVDMGTLPPLPDGEYYWQQLKGLKVVSQFGKHQSHPVLLGRIKDLMETGANDVLVVAPSADSIDQRERLLPYVDACVLAVDLDAGSMLVDWDPEF